MTGTIDIGQLPFTYRGRLASGELVNLWTISDAGVWTFHYPIDPLDASLVNFGLTASAAEINALDGIAVTTTIALAASATTDGMEFTITAKDAAGATVAGVHALEVWISEAATGIGLTADSYSGTVTAVSTFGSIHTALTAKKHFLVVTNAAGIFKGLAVDSANPTDQYVVAKNPLGAGVIVSAASGTSWEGA